MCLYERLGLRKMFVGKKKFGKMALEKVDLKKYPVTIKNLKIWNGILSYNFLQLSFFLPFGWINISNCIRSSRCQKNVKFRFDYPVCMFNNIHLTHKFVRNCQKSSSPCQSQFQFSQLGNLGY